MWLAPPEGWRRRRRRKHTNSTHCCTGCLLAAAIEGMEAATASAASRIPAGAAPKLPRFPSLTVAREVQRMLAVRSRACQSAGAHSRRVAVPSSRRPGCYRADASHGLLTVAGRAQRRNWGSLGRELPHHPISHRHGRVASVSVAPSHMCMQSGLSTPSGSSRGGCTKFPCPSAAAATGQCNARPTAPRTMVQPNPRRRQTIELVGPTLLPRIAHVTNRCGVAAGAVTKHVVNPLAAPATSLMPASPPTPPPPPRSRRVRCSQAASRRMHYKRTLAEGCRIQGQPDGKASRQANPAVHWEVVGRCSPWSAHPSGPRLPASTPSAAPPALPLRRDRARRLHRRLSFVRRRRVGPRLPGSLQLSYCRRAAA